MPVLVFFWRCFSALWQFPALFTVITLKHQWLSVIFELPVRKGEFQKSSSRLCLDAITVRINFDSFTKVGLFDNIHYSAVIGRRWAFRGQKDYCVRWGFSLQEMKCSIGSSFLVWNMRSLHFLPCWAWRSLKGFSVTISLNCQCSNNYFGGCVCLPSSDLKYVFNGLPRIFTEGFYHY